MLKVSDIEVFDCNQRLGAVPYGRISIVPPGMDLFGQEGLLRRRKTMTDAGIDATLMNPVWYYERPNGVSDTRSVNDRLAALIKTAPDLIAAGVGLAEPMHGAAGLDEIRRVDEELGFVGVFYAFHWQGCTINDEKVYRHFELLQERRMVALMLCLAESIAATPPMLAEAAAAFPDLTMIALDWGGSMQHSHQLTLDAGRYPNLHFDTSGLIPSMINVFVNENGPKQLLFGSDMYSHTAAVKNTPSAIRERLSDEAAQCVLRDNLVRILQATGRHVIEA
jgi:predicted TIM-barrel fold metal-dependent hydrolase